MFKVKYNQPVFLTKSEREELKKSLPIAPVLSTVVPVAYERSRSPTGPQNSVKEAEKKEKLVHTPKPLRGIFRFEWDNSDDTSVLQEDLAKKVQPAPLKGRKSERFLSKIASQDPASKQLAQMTSRDWKIFKENLNIITKNCEILPIRAWEECPLDKSLLRSIHSAGYSGPTPIQMQAIPISLKRHDLIGLSHTGSGKTAAYLLPILHYCLHLPRLTYESNRDGPYVLIISPTRELAQQISEECEKLMRYTDLRVYCIVGGKNIEQQSLELRKGAEIVIATPGRVLELLQIQYLVLNQCSWLVVDEADKIVLLELEDTLREILNFFPSEAWKPFESALLKQEEARNFERYITTQIFSATMDETIERLWRNYLRNPSTIVITDSASKVSQKFYFVDESEKKMMIKKVLRNVDMPVLVFVNEKVDADRISNFLSHMWSVQCLHGGKTQEIRENVMESFRDGRIEVLISTDVMSRGIDVKELRTVINYDFPKSIFDYEHRIGRTGRMGRKGSAITFVTQQNKAMIPQIREFLIRTGQTVPRELEASGNSDKEQEEILQ